MTSGGAQEHQAARLRPAIGETIIGVGVLALAIVMAWQALSMPVSPIYAQVGPTIVPIITALALGMLGMAIYGLAPTGTLFWIGIPVGCFGIVMIHHLVGGTWGFVIQRPLESAIRTLPVMALLFIPALYSAALESHW